MHLLQSENPENMPKKKEMNPKDNHISFLVPEEYKLVPDTLYLTMYIIHWFRSQNYSERKKLQLLGITCMLIASLRALSRLERHVNVREDDRLLLDSVNDEGVHYERRADQNSTKPLQPQSPLRNVEKASFSGTSTVSSDLDSKDIDSDKKDPQLCSLYAHEIFNNLRVAKGGNKWNFPYFLPSF